MKIQDMTVDELGALLKQAAKAHGEFEKQELGGKRDEDWPAWYADYMLKQLKDDQPAT